MNRKSRIAFGPGAASLILIVVVLSMSVLGMLALMNARNDSRLSGRSADVARAVAELNNRSERSYAALDELLRDYAGMTLSEEEFRAAIRRNLPAGMRLEEDCVSWEETDGTRTLTCQAAISPLGETPRLRWTLHQLSAVAGQ